MAVVECVPNISEGRRMEVVDACATAIQATGVRLLDRHSSFAHHRSVFTFVGSAELVGAAVLALVAQALATIDLRRHTGEHPRIGAVDVVPFVPIGDTTMAECVALARSVAGEIAQRFHVPVYLYEHAATVDTRRRLEVIRRGGFERLAERMRQPEWTPDFGPSAPHPSAGACVVGARMPLIAYNINLASDNIDIARRIAAVIRQSSGGLPTVKAIGVRLAERRLVQVSMNLTDFHTTSMATVFDVVKEEAARGGVAVVESELVGLVPAAALPPAPATRLLLRDFRDDQILENRLAGV